MTSVPRLDEQARRLTGTSHMRSSSWISALAVGLALLFSAPAHAQSTCSRNWPADGLHLAGRVGDADVRVFLDTGFPAQGPDGVFGVVLFPARWRPGADVAADGASDLNGRITADCALELEDSSGFVWRLTPSGDGSHSGVRERSGQQSETVILRSAPAVDCDGRGTWRTFTSPRWPFAFEYPSSWVLSENGGEIVIECPDPGRLAWGGAPIRFHRGVVPESVVADDGRKGGRVGPFVTFGGDAWRIGDCETRAAGDLSVFCNHARRSTVNGMMVLQGAAGEHRRYRLSGGYIGQGAGVLNYAFQLGNGWVLMTTEDLPEWYDRVRSAGPVIVEGGGITERLVRSIGPRRE